LACREHIGAHLRSESQALERPSYELAPCQRAALGQRLFQQRLPLLDFAQHHQRLADDPLGLNHRHRVVQREIAPKSALPGSTSGFVRASVLAAVLRSERLRVERVGVDFPEMVEFRGLPQRLR
jgi:hypothetical protein